MTKKKNGKLKEFLLNLWYYVSEAFTMAVLLILGVLGIVAGCFAALFLAVAPMQFSPWWGLLSIPTTLTLVIAIVMWRVDR
jgi:hypothetical protein